MNLKIFTLLCSAGFVFCDNSELVFTDIYEKGIWGRNEEGKGYSGLGSTLNNTQMYIHFLEDFIKANEIKTVVDVGCGDWTFSKYIQWGQAKYIGVDVVKSVIDEDIHNFGSSTVQFVHADILQDELPPGDLLICKDVLMHLTNDDVVAFLKKTAKYKHCLFTHNVDEHSLSSPNNEISRGDFRTLDLAKAPFSINGLKIFTYHTDHAVKQVFYITGM